MDEEVREYLKRIGSKGGRQNTAAQQAARKKAKPGAGRPKGSKNKTKTGETK